MLLSVRKLSARGSQLSPSRWWLRERGPGGDISPTGHARCPACRCHPPQGVLSLSPSSSCRSVVSAPPPSLSQFRPPPCFTLVPALSPSLLHPCPCSVPIPAPSLSLLCLHPCPCSFPIPAPSVSPLRSRACFIRIPAPSPSLMHPRPCTFHFPAPSFSLLYPSPCSNPIYVYFGKFSMCRNRFGLCPRGPHCCSDGTFGCPSNPHQDPTLNQALEEGSGSPTPIALPEVFVGETAGSRAQHGGTPPGLRALKASSASQVTPGRWLEPAAPLRPVFASAVSPEETPKRVCERACP